MVKTSSVDLPLLPSMMCGGIAGSIAEILTLPLDTAKVRLQLAKLKAQPGEAIKYKNLTDCLVKIPKEEGFFKLWSGYAPGIQRQLVFASLRIGLYFPMRNIIAGDDPTPSLWKKILTGLCTGAIGITVANPTDVVKIRMQADGFRPAGTPPRYTGTFNAYSTIYQQEGLKGFWTGWGPNVVRNSVINAAELSSYDQFKEFFLTRQILDDNTTCHIVCGFLAGLVAVIVGSPVDVMKTRMMNAKKGTGEQYKSLVDCFVRTLKEGPGSFYAGVGANFLRLASWNTAMFFALEKVRRLTYDSFYDPNRHH
jgi:solute carrier family 25 uncoupling protein 8/9